MNEGLLDPFRHNVWATGKLLDIVDGLSEEQRAATAAGTYGSIAKTLDHLISAEDYYRCLLTGAERSWRTSTGEPPSLEELRRRADEMAGFWEAFLAESFDPERIVIDEDEDGVHEIRAGMIIAQILNHGTDHRTQILTILTTIGVDHPDLDGWDYADATGRVRTTRPASG